MDALWIIFRKTDQRIDQSDGKVQREVHQVSALAGYQGQQVFIANDGVHLRLPPGDHVGHEDRLQQRPCPAVLLSVHPGQDQAVKKSAQAFRDEATGEAGRIPKHRHHVTVLEDRERRTVRILSRDIGHTEPGHEVFFYHGGIPAHGRVDRMEIDVGSAVVVRDPRERTFEA